MFYLVEIVIKFKDLRLKKFPTKSRMTGRVMKIDWLKKKKKKKCEICEKHSTSNISEM